MTTPLPTAGTGDTYTQGLLDAINANTAGLAAAAVDALVVHLAGTETITGSKTFSGKTTLNGLQLGDAVHTAAATLSATSSTAIHECDATAGAFAVTLPATTGAGVLFVIKKTDASANAVTVTPGTSIDGAASVVLSGQYDYVIVASTTTSGVWRTIASRFDSGWIAPTLTNSWTNFGSPAETCGYRKINGVVHLKGSVKSGATATSVFTLPAGYRPAATRIYALSGAAYGRVDVATAGTVTVTITNNTLVCLDGIVFPADA